MSDDVKPAELRFLYRNWQGQISWRWVAPRLIRWGATEFHPELQWLMEGVDLDKAACRTFALRDILQWSHQDDWKSLLELPWDCTDETARLRAAVGQLKAIVDQIAVLATRLADVAKKGIADRDGEIGRLRGIIDEATTAGIEIADVAEKEILRLRGILEQIACRDQGEVGPHMDEPRAAAIAREALGQ